MLINQLLASLPEEEYGSIAPALRIVPLPARHVLITEGVPIDEVLFPFSGVCSVQQMTEEGYGVEIVPVGREGMIGVPAFFGQETTSSTVIVAVPGDGAQALPIAVFKTALARRGAFFNVMQRYVSSFTSQLLQLSACSARHQVLQRLSRWLLTMHDRVHMETLPLTHEYISRTLGVRRPTVTLALAALQRTGAINQARGTVTILNRALLETSACECYGVIRGIAERAIQQSARTARVETSKSTLPPGSNAHLGSAGL